MIEVYVKLIMEGMRTLGSVPQRYRAAVEDLLAKKTRAEEVVDPAGADKASETDATDPLEGQDEQTSESEEPDMAEETTNPEADSAEAETSVEEYTEE